MGKASGDKIIPAICGGFALILFSMAVIFALVQSHISGRVDVVAAWPTTDATVNVNEFHMVDGFNPNTGKQEKVPRLSLEYTYEVDGRSYTAKNINIEGTGGPFEPRDYPVGSRMPVRYDPADPSVAGVKVDLTQMSLGGFTYACIGLSLGGLIFGIIAVRLLLKIYRSAPAA